MNMNAAREISRRLFYVKKIAIARCGKNLIVPDHGIIETESNLFSHSHYDIRVKLSACKAKK